MTSTKPPTPFLEGLARLVTAAAVRLEVGGRCDQLEAPEWYLSPEPSATPLTRGTSPPLVDNISA